MPLSQLKNTLLITLVYIFRMLGLFMVIPTLSIAWQNNPDVTALQIGLALGAYGFTQAILQIFLGWLSDKYSRKIIIVSGLLVFCIGSLVAAHSTKIEILILGRFLQGSGAIAGALSALLADITPEQHLSKSMAIVGIGIGLSFVLAMFSGPLFYAMFGLSGIFYANAFMAICAIAVVLSFITEPVKKNKSNENFHSLIYSTLQIVGNKHIRVHMYGVFFLHFVLMAIFVIIPKLLISVANIQHKNHGFLYLAINILVFCIIMPVISYGEKRGQVKTNYLLSIAVILSSLFLMLVLNDASFFISGLFLFFCGFNFLEATLPSIVAKASPLAKRGVVMGLYATCQFIGAAFGSLISGWILDISNINCLFVICSLLMLLWYFLVAKMKQPEPIKSLIVIINKGVFVNKNDALNKIKAVPGVLEAILLQQDDKIYVKVNKDKVDLSILSCHGTVM